MSPTREISLRHRAAFFVSGAHPGFRTTRLIMLTALKVVPVFKTGKEMRQRLNAPAPKVLKAAAAH